MQDDITATIQRALPDAEVRIESPDGTHYSAVVVSAAFEGMLLVKQHQLVLNALKEDFDSERLHALQLTTYTPAKWATAQREKESPLAVV